MTSSEQRDDATVASWNVDDWHTIREAQLDLLDAAAAGQRWPDGPREVSYVERRARPPIARRYDVILVNDHVEIPDVRHRLNEAVAAGSDHGMFEADFTVWPTS